MNGGYETGWFVLYTLTFSKGLYPTSCGRNLMSKTGHLPNYMESTFSQEERNIQSVVLNDQTKGRSFITPAFKLPIITILDTSSS
jgi:hypothetical protein